MSSRWRRCGRSSAADRAGRPGEFVYILFQEIKTSDVPAFRELVKIMAGYKNYVPTYDEVIR